MAVAHEDHIPSGGRAMAVHGEEHAALGMRETLHVVVGQTPPPVMQLDLDVVQGAMGEREAVTGK